MVRFLTNTPTGVIQLNFKPVCPSTLSMSFQSVIAVLFTDLMLSDFAQLVRRLGCHRIGIAVKVQFQVLSLINKETSNIDESVHVGGLLDWQYSWGHGRYVCLELITSWSQHSTHLSTLHQYPARERTDSSISYKAEHLELPQKAC